MRGTTIGPGSHDRRSPSDYPQPRKSYREALAELREPRGAYGQRKSRRAARVAAPLAVPMALGLTLGIILAVSSQPGVTHISQTSGASASASPVPSQTPSPTPSPKVAG